MGLFGSKNDGQVKKLKKIADKVIALDEQFSKMSEEELKDQRYDKFRAFGCFETASLQPEIPDLVDGAASK